MSNKKKEVEKDTILNFYAVDEDSISEKISTDMANSSVKTAYIRLDHQKSILNNIQSEDYIPESEISKYFKLPISSQNYIVDKVIKTLIPMYDRFVIIEPNTKYLHESENFSIGLLSNGAKDVTLIEVKNSTITLEFSAKKKDKKKSKKKGKKK